MQVQIVEFEVQGVSAGAYAEHSEAVAPAFAELPGLLAKLWIHDPRSNRAGGVYAWSDAAAREAYLASELYGALQANPALGNVRSRHYDVLERPSRITRGDLAAAPALR